MKYLLILFAVLVPIFTYAEKPDPAIVRTFNILDSIEAERKLAMGYLEEAKDLSVFIPDLGKRERMSTLIEAAIISLAAASNKRIMIISIGLGLIASIAKDEYETFCKYRKTLIIAEYHLDLYYFYDYVYRHLPREEITADGKPCRVGVSAFLRAMDYLFYSSRVVFELHDTLEENKAIITQISEFIKWIATEMQAAKYRFSKNVAKKINEKAISFCENFLEVLSECKNQEVIGKINVHIIQMLKEFELAEKYSSNFRNCTHCK